MKRFARWRSLALRVVLMFALAAALCPGSRPARADAGAFGAAGDGYALKDGKVYRTTDGKETPLEEAVAHRAGTDKGPVAWVLVDPEDEGMAGSTSGIQFFQGEDDKPAGFLPLDKAGECDLEFSQSGEKFIAHCTGGDVPELALYLVEGFARQVVYPVMGPAAWIDPHRFAFTRDDRSRGPRGRNGGEGRLSVAVHDSAVDLLTVVREATDTHDFQLIGIDHDKGVLRIMDSFVKDPADWDNEDKVESEETSAPIPAAG